MGPRRSRVSYGATRVVAVWLVLLARVDPKCRLKSVGDKPYCNDRRVERILQGGEVDRDSSQSAAYAVGSNTMQCDKGWILKQSKSCVRTPLDGPPQADLPLSVLRW